jgi:leucyl-tRNA synthetase
MVKKVSQDFENLQMNTAISQMMIFINDAYKAKYIYRPYLLGFIQLLACVAPHVGEELWSIMGQTAPLTFASWPTFDETKLIQNVSTIAVSVNGKFKLTIEAKTGMDSNALATFVRDHENVSKYLEGKTVQKVIAIADKLVNFIVV